MVILSGLFQEYSVNSRYLKAMNYKVNMELLVAILIDTRVLDALQASE